MLARILYYYFKTRYLNRALKTREQIEHYQNKQFKLLQKKVLSQSPFYKPYLGKTLSQWPIINKNTMMEHFNDINTLSINKHDALAVAMQAEKTRDFTPMIKNIAVGLSSGTSGNKGLFLVSPLERDAWAGIILAKTLPDGLAAKERIAFFLRANNQLYTTLNKSKSIQFHFFDLLDSFDVHIKKLNELNPTIISAPASVLIYLARHKSLLHVAPKKIISVAEVLEPEEKKFISQSFDCVVAEIYQCTEGLLAVSDQKTNTLLMNEGFLIVEKEWIDETRFVPIITDLFRHTQPIVRYRLDDVLIENQRSSSIYTEIDQIEGRLGDVCYGKRGEEVIPIFADLIRQCMVNNSISFDDYLINQTSLLQFTIAITPEIKNKNRIIHHLNQLFLHQNCELPTWHLQPFQQSEKGIKRRRIRSQFVLD